jgi:ABC-type transporter Mla subunit MlaD
MAQNKGWFKTKAKYFTFVDSAAGLKIGDPVQLLGFDAGRITDILPQEPRDPYNVYVEFELQEPNFGYMWTSGSVARVASADFLGKRTIEVTKGTGGHATYITFPIKEIRPAELGQFAAGNWRLAEDIYKPGSTQMLARAFSPLTNLNMEAVTSLGRTQICVLDFGARKKFLTAQWNLHDHRYDALTKTTKPYWLQVDESPALTERLEIVVKQVQAALPNILTLTNQLATVLSNSASLTSNLNVFAVSALPAVSNLTLVTSQLNQPGALGEWLLPTNINQKLDSVLGGADTALTTANTNLAVLAENLNRSLENLASMTSNLNSQVQANTNMLSSISQAIVDADNLVQGLKQHWFLRSAFKPAKTNAPPAKPALSPKQQGGR